MKPDREVLGVECAWIPAPPAPRPSRPWLAATGVLLTAGISLLVYDAWRYVALAFLS